MWGLKKEAILKIIPSRMDSKDYGDRAPNTYELMPLVSPQEKEALWQKLKSDWGETQLNNARTCARVTDDMNDIEAVENYLNIIDKYGLTKVKQGCKRLASYGRESSCRSRAYLVGILKGME